MTHSRVVTLKKPPDFRQAHAFLAEFQKQILPQNARLGVSVRCRSHQLLERQTRIGASLTHTQNPALVWCHHRKQPDALVIRAYFTRTIKRCDQIASRYI